jgi:hypothetical protein
MKNLPDDELFNKLKVRLENFEEQPDEDVWEAISNGIARPEPNWIRPVERSSLLLAVLLMLGAWYALSIQSEQQPILSHDRKETILPLAVPRLQDEANSTLPLAPSAAVESPDVISSENSDTSVSNATRRDRNVTIHNIGPLTKGFEARKSDIAYAGAINGTNAPTTTAMNNNPLATSNDPDSTAAVDSLTSVVEASPTLNIADSLAVATTALTRVPSKRAQSWRLYGVAMPSLTFLHVSPSTADDASFVSLNSPGVLSKERFSLQLEMGAQLMLARRLAVFTGLTYYQQSLDVSLEQLASGTRSTTTEPSTDFTFEPNTTTTTINYNQKNIGLTAGLMYTVSVGKILHQLGASLQYEYGIFRRSSESDEGKTNSFLNYRIFYRAEYGLNEHLSLFVQPSFGRSLLNDELLDRAIRVKQSRAGVGFGVLYRF